MAAHAERPQEAHNASLDALSFPDMTLKNSHIGHTASVLSVAVDPKEKYIATGGADATTCVWDTDDMVCIWSYYHMENPIRAISFSHDSKYMSMTGEDTCVFVENVETGHSLGTVEVLGTVEESSWNPSSHLLAYPCEMKEHGNPVHNIELRYPKRDE